MNDLVKDRDVATSEVNKLRQEIDSKQQEIDSTRNSVVEERRQSAMKLDQERAQRDRARAQLEQRVEDMQKRSKWFVLRLGTFNFINREQIALLLISYTDSTISMYKHDFFTLYSIVLYLFFPFPSRLSKRYTWVFFLCYWFNQ